MENINIAALIAENGQLKTENIKLTNEILELRKLNEWYFEQFKLAQRYRFGRASEQNAIAEQLSLFNEAEISADISVPEPIIEETITYKRKKRVGKRKELYDNLPVVQTIYELPEDQRFCPICGAPLHACGHEVLRREIEVDPAKIRQREHVQTVYGCRDCEYNDESDTPSPMIKAKVPNPVIAGSGIASPSLLAFIISNKYVLAIPLNRQEDELRRQGIIISRQTMANWCVYVCNHWLEPFFLLLHNELLATDVIHADETTLQVINEVDRKASSKSYMWVYLTGMYAEHQVVLFEYTQTRANAHPIRFLNGYTGSLNADGYAGYYALEDSKVTLNGCWAHARRKFVDALKTVPKELQKDHPAAFGVNYCDQLFKLERKYDELALSPSERHARRLEESKPVLDGFFAWAANLLPSLPIKSKLKDAVSYAVNQQRRLTNFLLDGHVEISNNRAERAIRPFAIGRNNWLFAYSPDGARASAFIYSIVETAKANGLVPFKYLEFLFETLPNIPRELFSDCFPWNPSVKARCSLSP